MGRWQDMDLEELEEQYSPSRWSRRMDSESVIQAHIDVTTAALQERRRPGLLHIPCCTSPMEMGMGRSLTFIFLRTLLKVGDEHSDRGAEVMPMCLPVLCCAAFPVFVYIHGGYWQCLRPHGCDGAPGAAQPCLPGEAIPQDQGYLLVWTLGRGSPGSHGLVHGLDRIWCGSRYQRSCSGKWPRGTVPSCVSHKQCLWLHPVRCLWLWPSTTPRSSAGSHRSTARLCARLVGLSLCWILPAWITLTSLRSCQRKLTS
ncbi:kynurenine formamidase isoform X10 [Gallus gallus]|uniref:kynurenine formamidase isoform X10 n=1 Tax=Gallus gallus TaxID=9031 RepID=UPI001AEB2822|nr:kynurenine formamidase isoform X10 [Gallus gallus]